MNLDNNSKLTIQLLFAGMAALGGLTAVLIYFQQKERRELDEKNARLDNEIKSIDLALKRHKANKDGVTIDHLSQHL